MCKWWWNLENCERAWQDFMRKKHLCNAGIYCVSHRSRDSVLWSDMLHIKAIYLFWMENAGREWKMD
jgi:hypothetical protein